MELKNTRRYRRRATIRLREYGEAIQGWPKGDLYVHIRVKAHKKFTREGDLYFKPRTVDTITAALGGEIDVETVDGTVNPWKYLRAPQVAATSSCWHGVKHPRGRNSWGLKLLPQK